MKKFFKNLDWVTIVVFGYILVALTYLVFLGMTPFTQKSTLGGDTVTPIAGSTYTLAGAGIASTDTSFTLTSFTFTQTGRKVTDADMSETFYMTLEPGSRSRQEIVSCTTVTQNADDTATISGCDRGLLPFSPYTASTTYAFSHAGGSAVIVADPPQLFNQAAFKDNDETITGSWSFPTPLGNTNAATKSYVDGLVTGGEVTNEAIVIAGIAGETVATGTLVYFDGTDQEWKKVDTDTTTTYVDKFIGLTQGAGTNANAISGGILLKGRDTTQTGLTPGSTYYAQATAGTIGTGATAQPVGEAEDTNVLYFDPVLKDVAMQGQENTFSATTTFTGAVVGAATRASTTIFTADGTYTKGSNVRYIVLEMVGAGGNGGSVGPQDANAGGGGGAGGYCKKFIKATDLNSTVTVDVGTTAGASSIFGGYGTTTGGSAGESGVTDDPVEGGAGGTSTGCDVNTPGQGGGAGFVVGAGDDAIGGYGGSSLLGAGGKSVGTIFTQVAGNAASGYGSGGGGAVTSSTNGASGGAFSPGVVIIHEYF